MLESSKPKVEQRALSKGTLNNVKVVIEGRESEFQPHGLKYAAGNFKI